jgi:hypothetical protein
MTSSKSHGGALLTQNDVLYTPWFLSLHFEISNSHEAFFTDNCKVVIRIVFNPWFFRIF